MTIAESYQAVLRAALLGTARAELDPALLKLAEELQLPLGNNSPEQLLQISSTLDRLRRTSLSASASQGSEVTLGQEPPTASPKTTAGLQLILDGLYPDAFRECLELLINHQSRPADHQLPAILELLQSRQEVGWPQAILADLGPRASWLAAQHPEWQELLPVENPATQWKRLRTGADLANLLRRWRASSAAEALAALASRWSDFNPSQQARILPALQQGLSDADQDFLLAALVPRRKEVRRAATRLLLQLREETTLSYFSALIANWLEMGQGRIEIQATGPTKTLLETYGMYEARKAPSLVLLEQLPPSLWQELTDTTPFEFVNRLATSPSRANDYLPPLAQACLTYADYDTLEAIILVLIIFDHDRDYWPKRLLQTFAQLPKPQFEQLIETAMDRVERVARPTGLLHHLALSVPHPWPERLSRNLLSLLLDQFEITRRHYLPMNAAQWRPLAYRAPVELFDHFRKQLRTATERPDNGGRLATQILQIMNFRVALHNSFP